MNGQELDHQHALRTRQLAREKTQREAAQGRRARGILHGDLGPVLRRWVSGTIVPVSTRLSLLSEALLDGRSDDAATLAASPMFGLPAFTDSRDLQAILRWCLKDDNVQDLVLAALGTVIQACASAGKPIPLTRAVSASANAARETCLGQFLTGVMGAKAMMAMRRRDTEPWQQRKNMQGRAAHLAGPVRSALPEAIPLDGRDVVELVQYNGEMRRFTLRRPEPGDWATLEVARRVKGEKDAHLATWCSFAMLILCCAQAEAGWFDLVKIIPDKHQRGRRRSPAHGIILSPEAYRGVKGDLDRWLQMGFSAEPMLAPPDKGDYLSVKHREVAGGRGPMGMRTNAKDSAAWRAVSEVIAGTAWSVPAGTLAALRDDDDMMDLAKLAEPDDLKRTAIINGYRKVAADEFYLPIFMDFRGRVYPRGHDVTYQGGDLQKGLLCFPERPYRIWTEAEQDVVIMQAANLWGHGMDKAPLWKRREWWFNEGPFRTADAKKPIQFATLVVLLNSRQWDRIPCQIDGTCNGLQHLTALFRDHTAAPSVNLCAASLEDAPADLYGKVAAEVKRKLGAIVVDWGDRVRATVRLDRDLCKRPVMVLPYGGTKQTIEEAMLEGILAQSPDPTQWTLGQDYEDWIDGNYAAFRDRPLATHPLLNLDSRRLGGLVWDTIVELLPRPMAAMRAFREIGKYAGHRALEWQTPFGSSEDALWVVQAKAKSDRTGLKFKGLELPGSVRGLKIRPGRDEVDAHAHITGIVANFIHSLDACHLARTARYFQALGGTGLGSIHDCLIGRPSEMALLNRAVRLAFADMHALDPLSLPVRIRDPKAETLEEFPSWYALAEAAGASFPERGSWETGEVLESAWFFS